MKYWCYYTDVVRNLERLEALYSQKKAEGPAYLIWQDDDGPSMIAGPGIEWHRGDGPPPDIDAITLRAGRPPAPAPPNRNSPSRKAWRTDSCVPCRHSWRHVLGPQARHQPDPAEAPRPRPSKKANKRSTNFSKPAQTCSHLSKKQQRRGRQSTLNTPNHLPSIKSKTSPSPAATTRNRIKLGRSQPNALRRAVTSRTPRPTCESLPAGAVRTNRPRPPELAAGLLRIQCPSADRSVPAGSTRG